MNTDTSKPHITLCDCKEIQEAISDNDKLMHDIDTGIGLPDLRWYIEHIEGFDHWEVFFYKVNSGDWCCSYKDREDLNKVYGSSWEQCLCKMYLREVHGKEVM